MSAEQWRLIVECPDYEVSSLGQVRRRRRKRTGQPGKPLVPIRTGAYLGFSLMRNGNVLRRYAHRLVAIALLGDPPPFHEVNHRDGNKHHNALSNLEYVTRAQNVRHALASGLSKPLRGAAHPSWKGGPKQKVGRPRGGQHWTAQRPERIARGERSGKNKVSAFDVLSIREQWAAGKRQSVLAEENGLSRAQVCRIVHGERWT